MQRQRRIEFGSLQIDLSGDGIALIADYYKGASHDKWLAAQTACASMSALLFLNLGGIMGESDWRTPFWAHASAQVMFALAWKFIWKPAGEARAADEANHAWHNSPWAGFPWAPMAMIVAITVCGSIFFYNRADPRAQRPGRAGPDESDRARLPYLDRIHRAAAADAAGVVIERTWFYLQRKYLQHIR